jgi:hypothetical protein
VKNQNWLQMKEIAAAGPHSKPHPEPYLEFIWSLIRSRILILYKLLQLQLDILYIKFIKT